MTRDELKKLLDELAQTQYESDAYVFDSPPRATLGPPATEVELDQLDALMASRGLSVPPSYRRFLELCNGVQYYRSLESFHLRSVQEILDGAKDDAGWDFLGPCAFVIGRGYSTSMCCFDPETVDEHGEMAVAEFNVEATRLDHPSFDAFLRYDWNNQREDLALERGESGA